MLQFELSTLRVQLGTVNTVVRERLGMSKYNLCGYYADSKSFTAKFSTCLFDSHRLDQDFEQVELEML